MTTLTADTIADTRLHRLSLSVASDGIDMLIQSTIDPAETIVRRWNTDEGANVVDTLTEAVYDNPLLTAEFRQVSVIIDNRRYFLMPDGDAANARTRVEALWPEHRTGIPLDIVTETVEPGRTVMAFAADNRLTAFVRRTFPGAYITHRMWVLARYYAIKNRLGNMGKIHVRPGLGRTDILAFGHEGLLLANTFDTETVDDAVYYTMAVAQHLDFDNERDRIYIAAGADIREPFLAQTRQFVSLALPEIFPADISGMGEAAQQVPFEMLILPLLQN